jgi:hypothetical protein
VTEHSEALDLQAGVFKLKDAKAIPRSVKRSAERSTRRRLVYINRAGKNLPPARRKTLEAGPSCSCESSMAIVNNGPPAAFRKLLLPPRTESEPGEHRGARQDKRSPYRITFATRSIAHGADQLCAACRHNRMIPDLTQPQNVVH